MAKEIMTIYMEIKTVLLPKEWVYLHLEYYVCS